MSYFNGTLIGIRSLIRSLAGTEFESSNRTFEQVKSLLEATQRFLKTCFNRIFCHLQFKLQSTELDIYIVRKMLIDYI